MEQNALVINRRTVILFDTGVGTAKAFGPDSGRLLVGLKSAGLDPKTSTRSSSPMPIRTTAGA